MLSPVTPISTLRNAPNTPSDVARVVQFFETLQPESVARMGDFYCQDAYFKDPFNEVCGLPAIQCIFSHMYVALEHPHFVVTQRVVQDAQCFLVWDFKFRFKRFNTTTEQVVRGTSHLRFDAHGRINYHRDYWDAAEELYEKLPVLRQLMRWLKRRANS
jgi:steroid Delta-isomerase